MPVASFVESPRGRPHVAMLGTYPPQLCGLATFGAALVAQFEHAGCRVTVVPVDRSGSRPASEGDTFVHSGGHANVVETADVLSQADAVVVQHEYGIYAGSDGDEVLEVLRLTKAPTIVVLHTVLVNPSPHQREVLEDVCALADCGVLLWRHRRRRSPRTALRRG